MSQYNYFGAAYTDVVALYPGVVAADLGGQSAIEASMLHIEHELARSLNAWLKAGLDRCRWAVVESRATAGQTVITVSAYWGLSYAATINHKVIVNYVNEPPDPPDEADAYENGDGVTVADSGSDTIKLTMTTALSVGDEVLMACDVDTSNAAFSIGTLKTILCYGAAALVGAQIYTAEETAVVDAFDKRYEEARKALKNPFRFVAEVPEIKERQEVVFRNVGQRLQFGSIWR